MSSRLAYEWRSEAEVHEVYGKILEAVTQLRPLWRLFVVAQKYVVWLQIVVDIASLVNNLEQLD